MTLDLKQWLWLWAGALALMLVAIVPLSAEGRTGVALMAAGCVALACIRVGRRKAHRRMLTSALSHLALPSASSHHRIVLVCGDGLVGLFGEVEADQPALRVTEQGCYLRVSRLEQLAERAENVLLLRPQWRGQLSVMFVVNPGERSDTGALAGQVCALNYQAALIRRRGMTLPLLLVSYVQALRGEGAWFSWEAGEGNCSVREAGVCLGVNDWQRLNADLATRTERLQASIQIKSARAWLDEHVLEQFSAGENRVDACLPIACAITLVPTLPMAKVGNLWQQWLRDRTGLEAFAATRQRADALLPFPDALLPLLPIQARRSMVHRASVPALWLLAGAVVTALVSSAWQNTLLLRQVSDDLRRYTSIEPTQRRDHADFALREQALAVLREDAVRLDHYYRQGEPLALGLGLYRGERLRALLLSTIAGHRYPSTGPLPARTVRLDSLSLFATGSARLKPDSTRVLIEALVGIKAQPGWLIVISGHTDAIGSDEHNLQLSRARAAAVHEWMHRMGDIPDSCFAVQGFGKNQPIASNDTEAGRQANRRVDIRLVPEAGACTSASAGPGVQPPVANAAIVF